MGKVTWVLLWLAAGFVGWWLGWFGMNWADRKCAPFTVENLVPMVVLSLFGLVTLLFGSCMMLFASLRWMDRQPWAKKVLFDPCNWFKNK